METPKSNAMGADLEKLVEKELEEDSHKDNQKTPWVALIQVFGVVAADALNLSLISSLVPDMCKEKFQIPEYLVGFFSGVILGSYSLANFAGGMFIGYLSDKIGRKPLILIGLCTGIICNFVFPLSTNIWMAIILRSIAGFTNNNNAVCRALVSDITTGETRTVAYAYQGGIFAISRAFSSAIAAFFFGITIPIGSLANNPYALPCFIGGTINLLSFVGTALFLPETLQKSAVVEGQNPAKKEGIGQGLLAICKNRLLLKLITIYCLNSFGNGCLLLALVLLSNTASPNGLGLSVTSSGIMMLVFGSFGALYQFSLGSYINRKYGVHKVYTGGTLMLALSMILAPFLTLLPRTMTLQLGNFFMLFLIWLGLTPCLFLAGLGFMCALPSMSTMIANSADPERQGITQGTNQSIASLLRGIGPFLMGAVFSYCVTLNFPFLLYWILAVVYGTCVLLHFSLCERERCIASGQNVIQEVTVKNESQVEPQNEQLIDEIDDHTTLQTLSLDPNIELEEVNCISEEFIDDAPDELIDDAADELFKH